MSLFPHLAVHAHEDAGQKFHNRDSGAQTMPDRTQLQANHPRANDDEVVGHLIQSDCFVRGDNMFAVGLHIGQLDNGRTGCDHDVFCPHLFFLFALDFEINAVAVFAHETTMPAQDRDLVLFHEEVQSVGQLFDDVDLAGHELLEIQLHFSYINAVVLKSVLRVVILVR